MHNIDLTIGGTVSDRFRGEGNSVGDILNYSVLSNANVFEVKAISSMLLCESS